jgi:hypothetical protein
MTQQTIATTRSPAPSCDRQTSVTKSLLGYGVIAGPLYVAAWLAQALTRDGFDLTRHPASVLANGELGWIQVANFVGTGLMTVAAAAGVRRALGPGPGATWLPRLLGGYGVALVAAGIFRADPIDGFPLGTPAGPAAEVSWHGVVHFVSAGIGFWALIAACLVAARRFRARGDRTWAAYSTATGVLFLGAFAGIASGSANAAVTIAFGVAVVLAWAWVAALSARLYRAVTR